MKIKSFRINGRSVSRLSINGKAVSLGQEPALCDALCFTAQEAGSTVKLTKVKSAPDVNLQTSTDGSSWTPYAVEDVITLANVNDKVYFKAVGSNSVMGSSFLNYNKFVMTGNIAASGNINSLLEEDEQTARTISLAGKNYCYNGMFNSCTSLTTAPELPATTLAERCYNQMFYRCTSLTQAPELPATTLANSCYESMFQGCTSLTTAPTLPATTLANRCYAGMFSGTSLTQAPELPVTTLANQCYNGMFNSCKALTQAPELPATTLASGCYNGMFYGCSSLTQAPELPATTLTERCYYNMFQNCSSLTKAPELPATTLANGCYSNMFSNCTSLTQAPVLPATTLAGNCYAGMFNGCKALTQAPELPATTLANSCYNGMFNGCTSLTTAPTLPATTLANSCYESMFKSCSSLTTAPTLPATTLAERCYNQMFQECTSLSSLKVAFTAWGNQTVYWLDQVAATGTFECPQTLIDNTTTRDSNTVPESWNMVASGEEPVQCDALCFTAEEPGSTVKLTKSGSAPDVNLQTSTDGSSWTPYAVNDVITLTNVDDKVYFKAVGSNERIATNTDNYNKFVMTGKIAASGNVNSLLEEDEETARTISLAGKDYCYYNMFSDCTSLTTAPELPATTLAGNCYYQMFYNCTFLTQAPTLPATTLTGDCYSNMFNNCTSLTTAPELPATALASYCYNAMFRNCRSLTTAPTLPATTLANRCYSSMFQNCTSLTQAPILPATTLAERCYNSMFSGCTSLSSLKVAFTAWGSETRNWLYGVAATGTFECPQALINNTSTRDDNTVPESWTMVAV